MGILENHGGMLDLVVDQLRRIEVQESKTKEDKQTVAGFETDPDYAGNMITVCSWPRGNHLASLTRDRKSVV